MSFQPGQTINTASPGNPIMEGIIEENGRELTVDYDSTESKTLDEFHCDDTFFRGIMGPVGSGKSVACSMEVLFRAMGQKPAKGSKYRRTKFSATRNTYRELADTTIATFQEWVPPEIGHWKGSEDKFEFEIELDDGTIAESEVLFRALDTPKDARKLLSLELTGAWFNEAREIPFSIMELMQTRVGRFPPKKVVEATWDGIWLDTNPPEEDSRFYKVFEEMRPDGYKLFRQPGGRDPRAENVQNLRTGYYDRLINGKTEDWIRVYVDGLYGYVMDGKPIFPEYKDILHCSAEVVPYIPGEPLYLGMDFGLTPACVYVQEHGGTYYAIDETVTEELGAVGFAEEVGRKLRGEYKSSPILGWGDPAGDERSAIRESETVFTVLKDAGIPVDAAPSQDPVLRRESVAKMLKTMGLNHVPRLIISPKCKYLRKGLRGAYCYKRIQVSGQDRFRDKPDKNIYSHICEALEYLMLGMGEGYNLISTESASSAGASRPRVIGSLG